MTNEEIKQALKEAEEQFRVVYKEHDTKVKAIRGQCKHEEVSYEHNYSEDSDEHYFILVCNVCGDRHFVEQGDDAFFSLWQKHFYGETQ